MLYRVQVGVLLTVACLFTVESNVGSGEAKIPFSSSLPPLPTPSSTPGDALSNLRGYHDFAGAVVNGVRPGQLPHDTLTTAIKLINEKLNLDWGISPPEQDTEDVANEFLQWLAPAIAAMVLGLILAVVVPFVGCCIVCCRMCGHCGAKSRHYKKKHQNTKCIILTVIFLPVTAMILVGAILGIVSIQQLSTNIGQFQTTVDNALDDLSNYLDGGAKQLEFIADDQFSVFESYVLNDLDRVGEWFEDQIESDIQPDIDDVLAGASSLLHTLERIDSARMAGNVLIENLKSVVSELISQVSTLDQDLQNLTALCLNMGVNCTFSSLIIEVNVNYTQIGNVTFIDTIDLDEIEDQINNATDILDDLSDFINSEAEKYGVTDTAKEEFQTARENIQNQAITAINDTLRDITSDGGIIGEARAEVEDALKYLDTYEKYWFGAAVAIVSVFLLVVFLFLIGVFCGVFGYSREVLPHKRTSVSHCGGRFLLLGIVVVFISTSLLLVVASASYGLATGVQKVCNDLQPPDYSLFREVADDPSVWGGYTLVGVVTRETVGRTVNLSISHLLSECSQDASIWKALDGDDVLDLSFTDDIDCNSFGVGGSGNGYDFLPFEDFDSNSIFPNLTDIENSYDIDFGEYKNLTNDTILSFSLEELESQLENVLNTTGPNGTAATLTAKILEDLQNISGTISSVQNLQMYIERNISDIEMDINGSQSELSTFTTLLDAFLQKLTDVTSSAVDDYVARLCGFVDEYIDYALETIKGDVGTCRTLSVTYDAIYTGVCGDALDGLNGLWLSIGCCFLFSIFAVVLGIPLSDYFRRAGTQVIHFKDSTHESTALIPNDKDDDVSVIHLVSHNPSAPTPETDTTEEQPLNTTQMDLDW